jgi:hypothetical protein
MAGLRRNEFPSRAERGVLGAGIRDHGGMPGGELVERVRELRARGRSPKEIARALKVPPATVAPLIRRLAAAEPRVKEAPLIGCWVSQGWSSSVRFTGHPEWPDTGPAETGASGLVIVVVARERGSSVRVCEFLVDTWCLGVKNTLGPKPVERRKLPSFCADAFRTYPGAPVEVPLILAQRIVFGAIGYARGLGFEPYADFAKAAGILVSGTACATWSSAGTGCPCTSKAPMTTRGALCTRSARTSATATSITWWDRGPDHRPDRGSGSISTGFISADTTPTRGTRPPARATRGAGSIDLPR